MPPAYEILLLNTAVPQIQAAQSGDTYVVPRGIAFSAALTLSAGTANGVPYLNGSKVLTTGSALTYSGNLLTSTVPTNASLQIGFSVTNGTNADLNVRVANNLSDLQVSSATPLSFTLGATEQMRLTTTGLGIGTSSPASRVHINNGASTATALTMGPVLASGDYSQIIWTPTSGSQNLNFSIDGGYFKWTRQGSEFMHLDSSGDLGLGVTPSAWGGGYTGFQLRNSVSLWGASGTAAYFSNNVFYDGSSRKHVFTGGASEYEQGGGVHYWSTAPSGTEGAAVSLTTKMTLLANGNLGIGETSPSEALEIKRDGATSAGIVVNQIGTGGRKYIIASTGSGYGSAGNLIFYDATAPAERARITSGGYFKASDNGTYVNGAGAYHELNQSANDSVVKIYASNASFGSEVVDVRVARNTTGNNFYAYRYYNTVAAAAKFLVADSGDVTNTNGTYGTISDAKMKTDIVDAGSQWSDIKALRFRKFKMKADPDQRVQLGVVAQEVELTSPGLVDEHADKDAEGNDLGTTTKSVKTSVLLMKAAVALQEAMARIETLEAEVAALKGN
jgi:hypothetical protein